MDAEQKDEDFYFDLFRMLDRHKRGFITCADLRSILQGLARDLDLTNEDIDDLIREVDCDGNGEISFHEFYLLMTEN